MKFKYLVLSSLCIAHSLAFSYNFAQVAQQILQEFNAKNIRSDFAQELYEEISKASENFTKNLSFNELEQYVDRIYLDFMATEIIKRNKNTYIALVWPVTVEQDNLIDSIFNKYCTVLCSKRILLDKKGAQNFLAQIPGKASHPTGVDLWFQEPYIHYNPMRVYLLECKENTTDYNEMKNYLTTIFSGSKTYIDSFEKKHGKRAIKNLYVTTKCKREIREAVKIGYAMHINDSHDETVYLGNIVFNENSIDALRYSDTEARKKLHNFNEYTALLKERLGNNLDRIVVYNSAVLSAYGLRDCGDIDFLHDPRTQIPHNPHPQLSNQNQFFKRLYVILEDWNGKHFILEDCPNAHLNVDLDNTNLFQTKISIDTLLYNPNFYFYFHGIKYATLDFMHYFKKKRGREKDLRDVALIETHFAGRN